MPFKKNLFFAYPATTVPELFEMVRTFASRYSYDPELLKSCILTLYGFNKAVENGVIGLVLDDNGETYCTGIVRSYDVEGFESLQEVNGRGTAHGELSDEAMEIVKFAEPEVAFTDNAPFRTFMGIGDDWVFPEYNDFTETHDRIFEGLVRVWCNPLCEISVAPLISALVAVIKSELVRNFKKKVRNGVVYAKNARFIPMTADVSPDHASAPEAWGVTLQDLVRGRGRSAFDEVATFDDRRMLVIHHLSEL